MDREHSRVAMEVSRRIHRVGEAGLLAHALEQARAHAPAEQRVEDDQGKTPVVPIGHTAGAEREIELLDPRTRLVAHGWRERRRWAGEREALAVRRREVAPDQLEDALVLDGAGRGHHEVLGAIAPAEVVAQRVRVEALHRLLRAEDRTPERVPAPDLLGEQLADLVLGIVLAREDLLANDGLLTLDLGGGEARATHDIREHVHHRLDLLRQSAGQVAHLPSRRARVAVTAEGLEALRDRPGVAALG